MKIKNCIAYLVVALLTLGLTFSSIGAEGSSCGGDGGKGKNDAGPAKAEKAKKRAKDEVNKLEGMLAALKGGATAKNQVELSVPGTVTDISGKGLSAPRPWTPQEKTRFDQARVNHRLPVPKGVW